MKAGWKTSEFWLSLITTAVGTLLASDAFAQDSTVAKVGGLVMATLSQLGYTYSRHQLKKPE